MNSAMRSYLLLFLLFVSGVRAEKILVSIGVPPNWQGDQLYVLKPGDSELEPYFHFQDQPKFKSGRIQGLRSDDDGTHVYFFSDHANIYTPAGRNLFRLKLEDKTLKQLTPGPHSGEFSEKGNNVVSGFVRDGAGVGYAGTPVYLEGQDMIRTNADGSFEFNKVPDGVRWLIAYNQTLDRFDAQTVNIVDGVNATQIALVPNSNSRLNFEFPVPNKGKIYYRSNNSFEISRTDESFDPETIYESPRDFCTGIPTIDAFDVSTSGKIVVYDYQEGCGIGNRNHVGLYILDRDGKNPKILRDMLNDQQFPQWNDSVMPVEVFWAPDETKIAMKASYGGVDQAIIVDANSGDLLSYGSADTQTSVMTLYGWNEDGTALLFSEYNGNPALSSLGKVTVNADGSLGEIVVLMENQAISSATWIPESE